MTGLVRELTAGQRAPSAEAPRSPPFQATQSSLRIAELTIGSPCHRPQVDRMTTALMILGQIDPQNRSIPRRQRPGRRRPEEA
ncbi:hypothetical protein C5C17_00720 [Pseudoclavibacter sp. RFBA6]|nr:hypothetical protein C5C17_00720 [Pseudoclavibacter sp. RFBA6]